MLYCISTQFYPAEITRRTTKTAHSLRNFTMWLLVVFRKMYFSIGMPMLQSPCQIKLSKDSISLNGIGKIEYLSNTYATTTFWLPIKSYLTKNICRMKFNMTIALLLLMGWCVAQQKSFLIVGTYTGGSSKGIYVYEFSNNNANATFRSVRWAENPSFLAASSNGRYIYAVNENGSDEPGKETGTITAFSFNRKTATLDSINSQPSGGNHPCYVTIDKTGKWLWAGNYSSGSLIEYQLDQQSGALKKDSVHRYFTGSGPNQDRQLSSHIHATVLSADNKSLYAPDLGSDKIWQFSFQAATGTIQPKKNAAIEVPAGSGPRHLAFHPTQPWAYLTEELTGKVAVFRTGEKWTMIQELSTYPDNYKGMLGNADVHVSPDGRFVYASNRGEANSLAIYRIFPSSGKLVLVGFQPVKGIKPRNFNFDPTGNFLLVANQESSNIVIFRVNHQTGLLTDTGKRIDVPNPVCIRFIP